MFFFASIFSPLDIKTDRLANELFEIATAAAGYKFSMKLNFILEN